jgi:hypothetical protein
MSGAIDMTPKVSGPRKNTPVKTARPGTDRSSDRRGIGPELAFAGATFAGFAAWGASRMALSPDLIMPAVATLFLVFAAAFAVVSWRHRGMNPNQVTYADVAGALTLIGLCAAATIDPDQMVRLVEGGRAEN